MIRQSIVQSIRPTLRSTLPSVRRAISITPARAAEGDTGAPKSGGAAQGYIALSFPFRSTIERAALKMADLPIVMPFPSANKQMRIIM